MIPSTNRSSRVGASVALALIGLLTLAAAPLAAATAAPDYGAVVNCRYHTKADTNWAFTTPLRRIAVSPPQVFATRGQQTVGWRFSVSRLINEGDNPEWTVTYTSAIQKRSATTTRAADFTTKRVGVTLPKNVENRRHITYTVTLDMLWYRANGNVRSETSYLMPNYFQILNGELWDKTAWGGGDYCPGVAWAAI